MPSHHQRDNASQRTLRRLKSVFAHYTSGAIRPKPYNPDKPVAFMHVPKTSGSALSEGLGSAFAPSYAQFAFDRALFGSFTAFETIDSELRALIHLNPTVISKDVGFLGGHMSYSTLKSCVPDAQLLTLIREPRSRILSHWLYWRSWTDDYLQRWGDYGARVSRAKLSLWDFLSSKNVASQIDNLTLRMLLWPHPLIQPDDFIQPKDDRKLVRDALRRLRSFAYVDIVENPRVAIDLSTWCARPIAYPRVNVAANIPKHLTVRLERELGPETNDRLRIAPDLTWNCGRWLAPNAIYNWMGRWLVSISLQKTSPVTAYSWNPKIHL